MLVASSIPVALLANIIRITATGILHDKVGGHVADKFYHDMAGWLMIPARTAPLLVRDLDPRTTSD